MTDLSLPKAYHQSIDLNITSIDAYKVCFDGQTLEDRVGIGCAGTSLGHGKEWFSRLQKHNPKRLKTLLGMGFQGCTEEVSVVRSDGRGSPVAQTISLDDYTILVGYEAIHEKNRQAAILLFATSRFGWKETFSRAFTGQDLSFLQSQIVHYSQWSYEDWQEVLEYNREELEEQFLGVW